MKRGLVAIALLAGGCQSMGGAMQPALLMQGDAAGLDKLKFALAKEMGRSSVDIGPSDPARSSTISVLPVPSGPLNDRDIALPALFQLVTDGQTCVLVREATNARVVLDGVRCQAA